MLCVGFCTLPLQFPTQTYAGCGRLHAKKPKNNGCEYTLETLLGDISPGSAEYYERRLCVRPCTARKTVGSV